MGSEGEGACKTQVQSRQSRVHRWCRADRAESTGRDVPTGFYVHLLTFFFTR